ncbi:MAG TPA: hypothetical protein VEI02_07335 [Planctomycetota bacterium]|nr:hypothetical protein [Planctomycetota bacterium]
MAPRRRRTIALTAALAVAACGPKDTGGAEATSDAPRQAAAANGPESVADADTICSGRVVDEEGRPAPFAFVVAKARPVEADGTLRDFVHYMAVADREGSFSVPSDGQKTGRLVAVHAGVVARTDMDDPKVAAYSKLADADKMYEKARSDVVRELRGAQGVVLKVVANGAVAGSVRAEIPGCDPSLVQIVAWPQRDPTSTPSASALDVHDKPEVGAWADADGSFLLRGVRPGVYDVGLVLRDTRDVGWTRSFDRVVRDVEVRGGAVVRPQGLQEVDLACSGFDAVVRVMDEDGAELRRPDVWPADDDSPVRVRELPGGALRLTGRRRPLEVVVSARIEGLRPARVRIDRDGDLRLRRGPMIDVVFSAEGVPEGCELWGEYEPSPEALFGTSSRPVAVMLAGWVRLVGQGPARTAVPGRHLCRARLARGCRDVDISWNGAFDVQDVEGVQRIVLRVPDAAMAAALRELDLRDA